MPPLIMGGIEAAAGAAHLHSLCSVM